MRHRVKKKTLKRDGDHRKALLKNLSTSLVLNESIVTTVSKAKYLRPYVEKLITKAKKSNDFNTVKYMKSVLYKDEAVKKIIDDLAPRFKSRNGGYTRIIKIGNRSGDNAPLAIIEFVEKPKKKSGKKTKKTEEKETEKAEKTETKEKKDKSKKTGAKSK
jgi:large subunit ribosomal protein L17